MSAKEDSVIEPAIQGAFELWSDTEIRRLIESREELTLLQQGMRDELQAEKERADYETTRADYETARANYETARADYETARADYEMARAIYEARRAIYETTRTDYEKARAVYEKKCADFFKNKLVHAVEEIADTKSISIPEACDLLSFPYEDYLNAKNP